MKIFVDAKEVCSLSDTQKKVLCNDLYADTINEEMCRRVNYVVMHKYEQCFKRLKREWDSKLAQNGVSQIPTDPDAYARLVFAQPNYKDRKARDLETGV